MIKLEFTGTPGDVLLQMQEFFGRMAAAGARASASAVSEVSSDKPPLEPTPIETAIEASKKAEPKKRGRPPKSPEPVVEALAEPEPQPEPEAEAQPEPEAPKEITVDDIRQVVAKYIAKHSIDVARLDIAKMMSNTAPGVANIGALGDATPEVRKAVLDALTAAVAAEQRLPGSEG